MKVFDCCEMIHEMYAQIGSGDQAYVPKAIACSIRALNDIAADSDLPKDVREKAAFAAANLLISDFEDA
ncbi:conserved hypothetical protein [Vibrio nigripulchritudo SO65]|uniref:YaeP family protein n=1 Tax=Vibrio nigripulchritudo TaxID=28173 RepID=UPI0003B18B93|nr:YaeP family protein [Vibrio nigripulchritudo]CCN36314.1 conserved hypothetical protein [Vibrio nigripulchritudo AM115]CCN39379.1 conserved hypothetical protein [Vibrio nigripulchritudo FTn2]CCN63524.1 conserved hypothetical protein [Vibrio nigripulchritudo POn4]CCN78060.1 conserved hypothetical protein [Vibrio nigripulchritudo SO65]